MENIFENIFKKVKEIKEKVGRVVIGKTPDDIIVKVPEDDFLNAVTKGIVEAGYGYWFSGEENYSDRLVFEFISTKAPKVEVIVYGKIEEE